MKSQLDCRFWAEKLAARHPDDCTPDEQHSLDAHVATCDACAVQRQQYLQLSQRVQATVANEPRSIFISAGSATFNRRSTLDLSTGSVMMRRPRSARRRAQVAPIGFAFVCIALLALVTVSILQNTGYLGLFLRNGHINSSLVGSGVAPLGQTPIVGMTPTPIPTPISAGPYVVLGEPTITAGFINQVLAFYHSPAAGKGQSLYDLGVHYNIDPAFALSLFMHESSFGRVGEARVTKSLGNLRCYIGSVCVDQNLGGYAKYDSWEAGFDAWYALIRNYYVNQLDLHSVDVIIPRYAPTADKTAEAGYIAAIKHAMDSWRAGNVHVA